LAGFVLSNPNLVWDPLAGFDRAFFTILLIITTTNRDGDSGGGSHSSGGGTQAVGASRALLLDRSRLVLGFIQTMTTTSGVENKGS